MPTSPLPPRATQTRHWLITSKLHIRAKSLHIRIIMTHLPPCLPSHVPSVPTHRCQLCEAMASCHTLFSPPRWPKEISLSLGLFLPKASLGTYHLCVHYSLSFSHHRPNSTIIYCLPTGYRLLVRTAITKHHKCVGFNINLFLIVL